MRSKERRSRNGESRGRFLGESPAPAESVRANRVQTAPARAGHDEGATKTEWDEGSWVRTCVDPRTIYLA